jgi:hypothetical protein
MDGGAGGESSIVGGGGGGGDNPLNKSSAGPMVIDLYVIEAAPCTREGVCVHPELNASFVVPPTRSRAVGHGGVILEQGTPGAFARSGGVDGVGGVGGAGGYVPMQYFITDELTETLTESFKPIKELTESFTEAFLESGGTTRATAGDGGGIRPMAAAAAAAVAASAAMRTAHTSNRVNDDDPAASTTAAAASSSSSSPSSSSSTAVVASEVWESLHSSPESNCMMADFITNIDCMSSFVSSFFSSCSGVCWPSSPAGARRCGHFNQWPCGSCYV